MQPLLEINDRSMNLRIIRINKTIVRVFNTIMHFFGENIYFPNIVLNERMYTRATTKLKRQNCQKMSDEMFNFIGEVKATHKYHNRPPPMSQRGKEKRPHT